MAEQHHHEHASNSIADDHVVIGTLLQKLLACETVSQMLPGLLGLREFLMKHFASEEAEDGGLAAIVREDDPNQLKKLDALFREHQEMLERLDHLAVLCRSSEAKWRPLHAEVQTLADDLRDHEERECELITDVVLTDIGGG